MIFLEEVRRARMEYRAILFEEEERWATRLQERVSFNDSCTVVNGRYQDSLMEHVNPNGGLSKFGAIYLDPSGNLPDLAPLAAVAEIPEWRTVDVLLYLSATTMKRVCGAFSRMHTKRFADYLSMVKKRYWHVREPSGQHQWTFAFGTNWEKYPEMRKIGFHRADSTEGAEIIDRLNYSARERSIRNVPAEPRVSQGEDASNAAVARGL
jgi:hypothetical protein